MFRTHVIGKPLKPKHGIRNGKCREEHEMNATMLCLTPRSVLMILLGHKHEDKG